MSHDFQLAERSMIQPMQLAVRVRQAFHGRREYPASSMLVLVMEEAISNHFRRASLYSGVVQST